MKLSTAIPLISFFIQSLTSAAMAGDWKNSLMSYSIPLAKVVSNRIQDVCPVDECVVIGIGRSPTLIIAQLKIAHENYAWNLPLSQFRYRTDAKDESNRLTPEEHERLNQHFDAYLPNEAERGGRKILLVDYASSGMSLVAAQDYLKYYFKLRFEKNPQDCPNLETFAMINYPPADPSFKYSFTVERGSQLGSALVKEDFDDFAEFGSFNILIDTPAQTERNPKYNSMLTEMKAYI